MYSVLNKVSECIYFAVQKPLLHRLFCLLLKLWKTLSVLKPIKLYHFLSAIYPDMQSKKKEMEVLSLMYSGQTSPVMPSIVTGLNQVRFQDSWAYTLA